MREDKFLYNFLKFQSYPIVIVCLHLCLIFCNENIKWILEHRSKLVVNLVELTQLIILYLVENFSWLVCDNYIIIGDWARFQLKKRVINARLLVFLCTITNVGFGNLNLLLEQILFV